MSDYEQAVFISYAWGGQREEIVNQIEKALQDRGLKIIRDKRALGYKGSIKGFMERIGRGDCVIVVVSDKYLRSPNCMFELVEIAENKGFHDRIFPIVLADADIYDPVKRLGYVKHWELKRAELVAGMRDVDPANLQGIREELDSYDRIRDKISGLATILKDMNTLTPEMHEDSNFSVLYDAIERRMKESLATPAATASEGSNPTESAKPAKNVSATNGSIGIGTIQVGGNVSGNIVIGNNNQAYYNNPALAQQPNLSSQPLMDEGDHILYTVKSNDTLMGIALKHNTTVAAITELNPQIINPNTIRAGWVLKIPQA